MKHRFLAGGVGNSLGSYPPTSSSSSDSSSTLTSGSFSNVGGVVGVGGVPVRVNAPDFWRNLWSARMPLLVPRISGRAIDLDTFSRMSRCCE